VRQRAEPGQLGSVVVGAVRRFRAYRNNRPQMSWPQAPEMEIANLIPIAFNRLPQIIRHAPIGIHVEQDRPCIPDQAIRPARDNAGSDDTGERVHPEPFKSAREQQADNHQHRNRRIGDHVDYSSAHIVVAVRQSVRVFMLVKNDGIIVLAETYMRHERMGFRNLFGSTPDSRLDLSS
jgi:hypothetical protein